MRSGVGFRRNSKSGFLSSALWHYPIRLLRGSFDEVSWAISVPLIGGGEFRWNIVRLDRALQKFAEGSESFRAALSGALSSSTDGRLSAIVYTDEVTPGNPLKPENRRRFWFFYVGMTDVGGFELS